MPTTYTMAPINVDHSGSITFMDIREDLPMLDPENLPPQNVLEILLYLFKKSQTLSTVDMRLTTEKRPGSMRIYFA